MLHIGPNQVFLEKIHAVHLDSLKYTAYRKIKVWDLIAALDPRAPASTLCLRTLVVSFLASASCRKGLINAYFIVWD
jgi:hypothetical protein